MEQDEKQTAVAELLEDFLEEQLWACIVAFQGEPLRTMSGLPYSYTLKEGKHGGLTEELWVTGGRTASPSLGAQSGWRSRMC